MGKKHIVIVGSSFAGLTAALELKESLADGHEVTVVSRTDQFVFTAALIWVPFGLRSREELTFPVRPQLERHGVRFRHEEVTRLDLENRTVLTPSGGEHYDYLLLATGRKPNYGAIPGLGPRGYTKSIMSLAEAEGARAGFEDFVAAPGPVVVGAVQGASCFGAEYELVFSMAQQLRARGLAAKAPLTFVTAEPKLGHFGMSGLGSGTQMTERFFEKVGIHAITGASIKQISPEEILLGDGRKLPFAYAILMPSFLGVDVVRACEKITNASGFVRVNGHGQTEAYPEVFAAGAAVAMDHPGQSTARCDLGMTGYFSGEMGQVAAQNVAAQIRGTPMRDMRASERVNRSGPGERVSIPEHAF